MNPTILKFGYPDTLVREFDHWVVLLRPAQITLGSLVLAARSDAQALSDLSPDAFSELGAVIPALERGLREFCAYEKLNYLWLMMVDREVHAHVLPRYDGVRTFDATDFEDRGWPKTPDLASGFEPPRETADRMRDQLAKIFVSL